MGVHGGEKHHCLLLDGGWKLLNIDNKQEIKQWRNITFKTQLMYAENKTSGSGLIFCEINQLHLLKNNCTT